MLCMNHPIQLLNVEFEKAMRLLAQHFPVSEANSRKPVFFHALRVGVYLYEREYSYDVVLGGLLHDALEWSDITEQQLREEFGDTIANIVVANTKDRAIKDHPERLDDLARRCVQCGQDALIVEAADTIDSFRHYTKTQNQNEIQYGVRKTAAIFKYKPDGWNDPIFDELKTWQKRYVQSD